MKAGTLTMALALLALGSSLVSAETIVVDDQVQVRPPISIARHAAPP